MKFTFNHNNINVLNLDKSINFYKEALGYEEARRYNHPDGSFSLVFLKDGVSSYSLELTWNKDRVEPYNLGENEFHMAVGVDDFHAAYEHHKNLGCICYENKEMGLYFINDPDGYWIEIISNHK